MNDIDRDMDLLIVSVVVAYPFKASLSDQFSQLLHYKSKVL